MMYFENSFLTLNLIAVHLIMRFPDLVISFVTTHPQILWLKKTAYIFLTNLQFGSESVRQSSLPCSASAKAAQRLGIGII